jgi:hypothetical protein
MIKQGPTWRNIACALAGESHGTAIMLASLLSRSSNFAKDGPCGATKMIGTALGSFSTGTSLATLGPTEFPLHCYFGTLEDDFDEFIGKYAKK